MHPVVCKKHHVFFVLVLTPTNWVEISNKHFVPRCFIKINGKFENPTILFDTGVISENFMDKSYALQHNIYFVSLINFHFAGFRCIGCNPQFTRLFITDIPQFFIMINFFWMKTKFTTSAKPFHGAPGAGTGPPVFRVPGRMLRLKWLALV